LETILILEVNKHFGLLLNLYLLVLEEDFYLLEIFENQKQTKK
jgi:hypothetical protein